MLRWDFVALRNVGVHPWDNYWQGLCPGCLHGFGMAGIDSLARLHSGTVGVSPNHAFHWQIPCMESVFIEAL